MLPRFLMVFPLLFAIDFYFAAGTKLFAPIFHFLLFLFDELLAKRNFKFLDIFQLFIIKLKHILNMYPTLIFGYLFILMFIIKTYLKIQCWLLAAKITFYSFIKPFHLVFSISHSSYT